MVIIIVGALAAAAADVTTTTSVSLAKCTRPIFSSLQCATGTGKESKTKTQNERERKRAKHDCVKLCLLRLQCHILQYYSDRLLVPFKLILGRSGSYFHKYNSAE